MVRSRSVRVRNRGPVPAAPVTAAHVGGVRAGGPVGARGGRAHCGPGEEAPVEATLRAGVAGGTGLVYQREQGIGVAVVAEFPHLLDVAGGLPLVPETLAGAAPEPGVSAAESLLHRFPIHVGEHEHLAGGPLLHHARHQAVRVESDICDLQWTPFWLQRRALETCSRTPPIARAGPRTRPTRRGTRRRWS